MGGLGGGGVGEYLTASIDNLSSVLGTMLLVEGYSGALVRLRRSTDNTEQDFSPLAAAANSPLDSAALTTFASGGTLHVAKWYDQGANGYDFVMATAGTQPTIDLTGSFPVVSFASASGHRLAAEDAGMFDFARNVGEVSLVCVRKFATSTGTQDVLVVGTNASVVRAGLRGGASNHQMVGRRLDADGVATVAAIAMTTTWGVEVGRFDWTNTNAYHRVEATTAEELSFLTAGVTSNTASNIVGVGGGFANTFNGLMSAAVFVRDLLTDAETETLVARGASLKAA